MVQVVDFLPASYHEQLQMRKKRTWRRFVLLSFAVLTSLGAFGQWTHRRMLSNRLERVETQLTGMQQQVGSSAEIQQQIDQLDRYADLLAQLQLQLSMSRVIDAVSAIRPDHVSFNELSFTREARPSAASTVLRTAAAAGRQDPNQAGAEKTVVDDLAALQRENQQTDTVLIIDGLAPTHLAVSQYMSDLNASGLFSSVRLDNNERLKIRDMPHQKFRIRTVIRWPSAEICTPRPAPSSTAPNAPIAEQRGDRRASMPRWLR